MPVPQIDVSFAGAVPCPGCQPIVAATLTGRAVTLTATAGATYYVIGDGPLGGGADFGLELTCP